MLACSLPRHHEMRGIVQKHIANTEPLLTRRGAVLFGHCANMLSFFHLIALILRVFPLLFPFFCLLLHSKDTCMLEL